MSPVGDTGINLNKGETTMWLDTLCTAAAIVYLELGLLMSYAISKLYGHEQTFVFGRRG
jgi:predicted Na+-dependent transporter